MSVPQGQEVARVKREDSPEVMEMDSQEYADNPHQAVAKILNDKRIGDLDEKRFREVEKYVSALLLSGQAQTLSSFGCLLDSKISLVSYVRFLENAALPYLEGRGTEQTKEQPAVKREDQRESSSGVTPTVEGLNDIQIKIISEALAKMSPLPENMGSYDTWIRIMRRFLRLEDESLWPNDISRIRGVLSLCKKILSQSKGFSAHRKENFLRYAISAVKLPMKTFWTGLHASITYETPFTIKWCNLRMYGGWPGFDRLELRMNSIARVSFGVSGWSVIKDLKPFLHILCAMTPAPIWKRLMEVGIEDAKDYLEECIKIRDNPQFFDRVHHSYTKVIRCTFGVPSPEEVDKVGMGTIAIDPRIDMAPERDSFVYNPVLLSHKNPSPRFHQCLDLMICEEIKSQLCLSDHHEYQPVDIYSKWETLRVRGGWPGFSRLSYRMDVIAREMFGASGWKDLNIHPAFLHVLAAMTPTPLWTYMTRYMSFDDAEGYYQSVMSLKSKLFAQPLVMKHMFGVPLPFEADRLGFGTHYISPSRNVGPEFLPNPVFHVCEDLKPKISSQVAQLPEGALMKYAAGVIPKPSSLPQPSLMDQLPCPENAVIEIPAPDSGSGVSQQLALPPSGSQQTSEVQQSTAVVTSQVQLESQAPKATPQIQGSNSQHSSQNVTPQIQRPNSEPFQQAPQVQPSNGQLSSLEATPPIQPSNSLPSSQGATSQVQQSNSKAPPQNGLAAVQSSTQFVPPLTKQFGKFISAMTQAEVAQLSKTQRKKMRKEEEKVRKEDEEKKKREDEEKKKREDEERKKREDEERKKREDEERKKREDEERKKREDEERKKREDEERKKREDKERRIREEDDRKKKAEEERKQREEEAKRYKAAVDEKMKANEERHRAYVQAGKRLTENEFEKKQQPSNQDNRNRKDNTNDTNKQPHPSKKLGDMPPLGSSHLPPSQPHPQRNLSDVPSLGQGQQPQGRSSHPQYQRYPPYNHSPQPWQQRQQFQQNNHHRQQQQQQFQQNNYQRQQQQQQQQQHHAVPPWEHRKRFAPPHHQLGGHQLGGYQNQNQHNKEYSPVIDLSNSPSKPNNSSSQVSTGPRALGNPNESNHQQEASGTSLASRLGLPKRPFNEWDSFPPGKRSKKS